MYIFFFFLKTWYCSSLMNFWVFWGLSWGEMLRRLIINWISLDCLSLHWEIRLNSVGFLFEKLISLRILSTLTCCEGSELSDWGVVSLSTGWSPKNGYIWNLQSLLVDVGDSIDFLVLSISVFCRIQFFSFCHNSSWGSGGYV